MARKKKAQAPALSTLSLAAYFQGETSAWLRSRDIMESRRDHWGFSSEIVSLPVEALSPHPRHPRPNTNDPAIFIQLAHSIRYHGLGKPLIVMSRPLTDQTPGEPEQYWVIDGLRRLKAVSLLPQPWTHIKCYVSQGMPDHMVMGLMLAMQGSTKRFNALELGIAFKALREELGVVQETLSAYLRINRATISLCENLSVALIPEVIELLMQEGGQRLGHNHFFQLARLQEMPMEQLRLCRELLANKWSCQALKMEVNQCLQQAPVAPINNRRQLLIETDMLKTLIRSKTPGHIGDEEIKEHLAQVNLALARTWGLNNEELADYYDRLATFLRRQARQAHRA